MKRILSIIIVLLLCVSAFAGCEKPDAETLIAKHENDCENIDQKLASEIKIAYSQYTNDVNYGGEQRFTPEDIFILRYEGEIGGCHFVMLGGDEIDYTTAFRSVEVAGYVVEFSSGQPMYAYKEGNFYTLKQAYDNGILTDSDVYEIGIKVDPSFAERYTTPDKTEKITYSGGIHIIATLLPNTQALTESQLILDLLNNGEWFELQTNCLTDYVLSIGVGNSVEYCSGCGTFRRNGGQIMELSEDDKATLNEYLEKLFEHIDPSEE